MTALHVNFRTMAVGMHHEMGALDHGSEVSRLNGEMFDVLNFGLDLNRSEILLHRGELLAILVENLHLGVAAKCDHFGAPLHVHPGSGKRADDIPIRNNVAACHLGPGAIDEVKHHAAQLHCDPVICQRRRDKEGKSQRNDWRCKELGVVHF